MAIAPKLVLQLIHLRRSLKGAANTLQQSLESVESLIAGITPKCRPCFYERGLIDECRCANQTHVDKREGSA